MKRTFSHIKAFMGICLILSIIFGQCCSFAFAEEVLRIKGWNGLYTKENVQKFEKYIKDKYKKPLRLEISYSSSPDEFFDALRSQDADMVSLNHAHGKTDRYNYIEKKIIIPINIKNIPNYKNIHSVYKDSGFFENNNKQYGIPYAGGVYGFYYNSKLMPETPKNWKILWNPKYKGKYSIAKDYYETNIYFTALASGFDLANDKKVFEKIDKNQDFKTKLKYLVQNADHLWEGEENADKIQNLLMSTGWGPGIAELNKRGKMWKQVNPAEGNIGYIEYYSIGYSLQPDSIRLNKNKAKRDRIFLMKAAEEWINYSLSPEYQVNALIRDYNTYPSVKDLKQYLTPEEINNLHIDDIQYLNSIILWPASSIREKNMIRRWWRDAMQK